MARYDVMKETYTEIRVLEKPALFSGLRLNPEYSSGWDVSI